MPTPTTETVTLLRDLEHRGEVRKAGEAIEIRSDLRARLERNGYIEPRLAFPRTPEDVMLQPHPDSLR